MQTAKRTSWILWILFFLLASSAATYLRTYPLRTHLRGETEDKASALVIARLRAQIAGSVRRQNPDMSPHQQNLLSDKLFTSTLRSDSQKVRESIDSVAEQIAAREPASRPYPYLLASDSYYYYDLTRQVLATGRLSDMVRGSKYLHHKMLAPLGHWEPFNLHPYIGAGVYTVMSWFNKNIDLMRAVSYTPLILTIVSLLAFLTAAHRLGVRPALSFVGAMFFACSPIFIKRSSFGWYDNDPYNTLFPLILLAISFHAARKLAHTRTMLACILLMALTVGLYAHFWQGWMMVFCLLLAAFGLIWILERVFFKDRTSTRTTTMLVLGYPLFTLVVVGIAFGFREFFVLFEEGWIALRNFLQPQLSPWPDLYLSVGELHRPAFTEITRMLGGPVFLTFTALGLILPWIPALRYKSRPRIYALIILTILLLGTTVLSLGAKRFAVMMLPAAGLLIALGLDAAFDLVYFIIPKSTAHPTKRKKILLFAGQALILLSIFFPVRYAQRQLPELINPIFNPTWEKALLNIREQTPEESIVNTWWPPGHFIKAIADRAVTFDGASINYPQAYWISRFFLSENEAEAAGILRMLNLSGNKAAEYMQTLGFSLSRTVAMLTDIAPLDSATAETYLREFIPQQPHIDQILTLTHGDAPPTYCLIYNEFVENNIQLTFFGKWNFERIEEINANPELMARVPQQGSREYVTFLWSLVGGPPRYSGPLNQISEMSGIALFKENITVHLETMETKVASQQYGKGVPYSLFYLENNELKEKVFDQATLGFSVALVENAGQRSVILLDRSLARSMLMRLYFYNAAGLQLFRRVIEESDLTKRTVIKVFEMDTANTRKP